MGVPDLARRLADDVLFPAADEIDASATVPRRYLDSLADEGLYDLPGPPEGPLVIEALGGASLVTAFVWIQHHSAVRAVAAAGGELAGEWLGRLRSGRVRAGIAYAALRRPGPPAARAEPADGGGWTLHGHAPWVTGWGLIDVILTGARHGEDLVWLLIDARERPGMTGRVVRLAALDASSTVELRWDGLAVPAERVVGTESFDGWRQRDRLGLSGNGYLAVGVAARAARLLGSEHLTASVDGARRRLDTATVETVADARADASLLAVRAASALVAAGGGRSAEAGSTAARLMREAMFLLVFGQTDDIRERQLRRLAGT